jgi:hypothetical protein
MQIHWSDQTTSVGLRFVPEVDTPVEVGLGLERTGDFSQF